LAELFRGAKGAAATLDLDEVRSGRPIRLARKAARSSAPRRQARMLFGAAGDGRPCADAGTGSRIRKRCATRALAVAAVDRARLFPGPHRLFGRPIFLRRREGDRIACCHPEEAQRRGLPDGAKVRVFNERGAVGSFSRSATEVLPGVVLVPGSGRTRGNARRQINMLCSDRYTRSRDAHIPEHVSRRRGLVAQ